MTQRALIGYTGFVGGNLLRQSSYDALFHSRNIEDMAGRSFDEVICAGAPAAKWIANRDPEADKRGLDRLADAIDRVEAESFALISTIDVYPVLHSADEDYDCAQLPNHAYGSHRLWLEGRVRARFPDALIVRLPALFGPGLKKNVLYDLLNDNAVEAINPSSTFQWYGLDRLTQDVETARANGLSLVNLFTEPLRTGDITELFPERRIGKNKGPEAHYALRTRHASLFGGVGGYVQGRNAVLAEIGHYVAAERARLVQ